MRIYKFLIFLIVPFFIASCGKSQTAANDEEGDTLFFKYAQNINIIKFKKGIKAIIYDPWNRGKILHTYTLVPRASYNGNETQSLNLADNGDEQGRKDVVQIPICKALITTSVHCELLKMLGKEQSISSVCDIRYMNSTWIHDKYKNGEISNCGSSMSPDIEKVIDISPDAIFLSPMQNNGSYGKIENIGIPIIEMADYMENSPLGRAEWAKFYGLLFGCEKQAQLLFVQTEKKYLQLRQRAKACKSSPLLLMDKMESGAWFLPGGNSTIAQMIADANINYTYSADTSAGSIKKSKESVLETNSEANLWMVRYYNPQGAMSLKELLAEDNSYSLIKAFSTGNVYGCNTATSLFFEETPFRPDLLLQDFILAAHPEIKDLGKMRYFFKLKK